MAGAFSLKPEKNVMRNVYQSKYNNRNEFSKTSHGFRNSKLVKAQKSYLQHKTQSRKKYKLKQKRFKPRQNCNIVSKDLFDVFLEEQKICKSIHKSNFIYKALWNYFVSLSGDRNVAYGIGIMKDMERNLGTLFSGVTE